MTGVVAGDFRAAHEARADFRHQDRLLVGNRSGDNLSARIDNHAVTRVVLLRDIAVPFRNVLGPQHAGGANDLAGALGRERARQQMCRGHMQFGASGGAAGSLPGQVATWICVPWAISA